MISFAVVLEGMAIAAYAILLIGGKQRREQGWGALAMLTSLAAIVQAIGMALIVRIARPLQAGDIDLCRHISLRTTSDFSLGGI